MKSTMANKVVQSNLVTGVLMQNAVKRLFEETKDDVDYSGKQFLNQQINRLDANLRACKDNVMDESSRQNFTNEMTKADAILFANVFVTLLACDEKKREAIEKLILAIQKGEGFEIEFTNQ